MEYVKIKAHKKTYFIPGELDYVEQLTKDSILVHRLKSFRAYAVAPLKISLPLLGYNLQCDLIEFSLNYNKELDRWTFSYIGYFYYQSVNFENEKVLKRIDRNRKKAYFNSSLHFLRSLYVNQLNENGYQILESIEVDETMLKRLRPVNLDTCIIRNGTNEMILNGLKNKTYYIHYYMDYNGFPNNLRINPKTTPHISMVTFTSDWCRIRKNGTTPDATILFSEEIGEKQIGATLPSDYEVSNITDIKLK
ncbi:MAG: hypothetical protein HC906_15340 [Bacteroidales bacterium]|nr:hypothetical protein [Bacteroidales bacterium]